MLRDLGVYLQKESALVCLCSPEQKRTFFCRSILSHCASLQPDYNLFKKHKNTKKLWPRMTIIASIGQKWRGQNRSQNRKKWARRKYNVAQKLKLGIFLERWRPICIGHASKDPWDKQPCTHTYSFLWFIINRQKPECLGLTQTGKGRTFNPREIPEQLKFETFLVCSCNGWQYLIFTNNINN